MSTNNYWTSSGISRRNFVAGSGPVAVGAAALLAGCGGGGSGKPSATNSSGNAQADASAPKSGGTIRTSFIQQDNHLSPYHTGSGMQLIVIPLLFDGLWDYRPRAAKTTVMMNATKVEQPDDSTFVITMSPSVFQNTAPVNGRAVTADDIKADVEYIRQDATTTARSFLAQQVQSVSATADLTLTVATAGPQGYFYESFPRSIVPKELLAGGDLRKQPAIGSGPWQLGDRTPGSFVEFVRFPQYRRSPIPYVEKYHLTLIADPSATETAFRSNKLDIWLPNNYQTYKSVLSDLGKDVVGKTQDSARGQGFAMNPQRNPFKDIRVRKAVYRALDRQKLLTIVEFGQGTLSGPVGAAFPKIQLSNDEIADSFKTDPVEAKQLLQQAGFDLTKTYDFVIRSDNPTDGAIGPLVKDQLAAVGIKVNIVDLPQAEYQQRTGPLPGQFDFALAPISPTIPQLFRDQHSDSLGLRKSFSLKDPTIDALIVKSEGTVDEDARIAVLKDIQRKLLALWAPYIPLYFPKTYTLVRASIMGWDDDAGTIYQPQLWLNQ